MSRKSLTLRDKVALMYTSAGSQRNIAAWIGVSHQKIGRVLHHPEFGGYKPDSRVWTDPAFNAMVDAAFAQHVDLVRAQARADRIPFDSAAPVFARRLPMHKKKRVIDPATGEITFQPQFNADGSPVMVPGLRIVIENAHWLPDDMRRATLRAANQSGFYHNASIGSWVDLKSYFKSGEQYWKKQNARGKYRTPEQQAHRENLRRKIKRGNQYGFIYTGMTPLNFPNEIVFQNIDKKVNEKHAPAAIDPNAKIWTQVLLQTDIAKDPTGGANIPQAPSKDGRKSKPPIVGARKRSGSASPKKSGARTRKR